MVTVKRALSARAQEALELIAGATVFHTIQDTAAVHLHAEHGNATLSLVLPTAYWAEIRGLVQWVDDPEMPAGRRLEVKSGTAVRLFETMPAPSNDPMAWSADIEQLDLPLLEESDYALLEKAGQQTLEFH